MSMRYIMGVDGGGSKTYAVIVEETANKVGSGVSGSSNHQVIGVEQAFMHIKEAIDQALEAAGLVYKDITFIQYGLAGLDREMDYALMRPVLNSLPFSNWDMVGDTMEGLRTGSYKNAGVVLLCGSGTNAAGRNDAGQVIQVGGVGYLY